MHPSNINLSVQLPAASSSGPAIDHISPTDDISIECYENEVPPFAGAEIDRLYGHLLCSFSHFQAAKQLGNASTYVARRSGVPVTVILYQRTMYEVNMISEFVTLTQEEIQRFADYMFARFKSVRVVSFNKVQTAIRSLPYPYHIAAVTEDIVVPLPPTVKEYEDGVGKNMRRNIKRYTTALQQNFPSYRYQVYVAEEVSEQQLRDIIALNRARMAGKNLVSRIDEEETRWIVSLARTCGIVGVATIGGRVCAGAIGFRIGANYFMHVIAHDPEYNDYSLGILCYYFTICEGIVRGGKEFHLLPGRYEYKFRLLGQLREIVHVDIYRGRAHAIVCGGRVAKKAFRTGVLAARQWLLDAERRDDLPSRLAGRAVHALRMLKRSKMLSAQKQAEQAES